MGRRCHSPGCAASARGHICTVPSSARRQMTPHRKADTIAAVNMTYQAAGTHDHVGIPGAHPDRRLCAAYCRVGCSPGCTQISHFWNRIICTRRVEVRGPARWRHLLCLGMLDERAGNRAIARVEWLGFVPDDVAAAPAAAIACLPQRLVECIAGVGGRLQHAGVGDQCEAERLVGLVAKLAANVALMGDEQGAAQRVQALALVELAAYSPPEFFAGDVAADAVGAHKPGRTRAAP
jgi:hypothetical protein